MKYKYIHNSGNKDFHDTTIGTFSINEMEWLCYKMMQNCQETFKPTICKYIYNIYKMCIKG